MAVHPWTPIIAQRVDKRARGLARHEQRLANNDATTGELADRSDVARHLGFTWARVAQRVDLTLLAPDTQERVLKLEPVSERELRVVVRLVGWRSSGLRDGRDERAPRTHSTNPRRLWPLYLARPDADPLAIDRQQRAGQQVIAVSLEHEHGHRPLLSGGDAHKAHDSSVGPAVHDGQLPEVLVERDDHPPLGVGPGEELVVAGILGPVAGPHHVVPRVLERAPSAAPDARVEEHLQPVRSRSRGS